MRAGNLSLGAKDFLAVLMPGVVLLYAAMELHSIKDLIATDDGGVTTLVFAAAAYGVGSLAYAIGATLDWLHEPTVALFVRPKHAKRVELLEGSMDNVKQQMIKAHPAYVSSAAPEFSNKSFFYDYLRLNSPSAASLLEALESRQKLFRTFYVVLVIISLDAALTGKFSLSLWTIIGAIACFGFYNHARADWRYRLCKLTLLAALPKMLPGGPASSVAAIGGSPGTLP
ncbi:hypothetical protein [Sphingomonas hengshuiensis]|uniref:Uncharacterized protein n=1 Tax=Sphingomonas hengshuiensis TaxID=1609977 RepID=A0A7U4J7S6_9SPHN|nr:hypothetical protein [Sphingomonas hengshuiensis]AJP71820.1 hypothetical protein TS85_08545 [Sphingomonas hengshuiensis]